MLLFVLISALIISGNVAIWEDQKCIVGGFGTRLFGHDALITHEQLAIVLCLYAGNPPANCKEMKFHYADEAVCFALEVLQWAVEKGIINGSRSPIRLGTISVFVDLLFLR